MNIACLAAVFAYTVCAVETCRAAELWSSGPAVVRLDTTLQFTGIRRVARPQGRVLADFNADDGDRAFRKGAVSNRLDVFSELDADYGDFGVRLSGAGWYDPLYLGRTANDSPVTFNPFTVPNNQFPKAVRRQQGLGAELLDAFAHYAFDIDGMRASVRAGRHTLIWGENLFFAANSIAAAQAPIDTVRSSNAPYAPARQLFLPVNQISAALQIQPGLSVEAYYQLEWRPDRQPGVGSYFSAYDYYDAGGEWYYRTPGVWWTRGSDRRPPSDGQFGLAVRAAVRGIDLGFYALRYHAHAPFVTLTNCLTACTTPGEIGTYRLNYASGIGVVGASASTVIGRDTAAGEISFRRGGQLLARRYYNAATVPRGDTLHAQVSVTGERPASALWDRVSLQAEVAGNVLVNTASGAGARDPQATRAAAAVEQQITFDYYHVLPALDLAPFVGLTYGLFGRSSVDAAMVSGTGSVSIGMSATFRNVWHGEVRLTDFIGSAVRQPFADRDFVAFNLRRSF